MSGPGDARLAGRTVLVSGAARGMGEAEARLFAEAPQALAETIRFLDGLKFSLDELSHCYPEELREGYATPQAALEAFAGAGARKRYPVGKPFTRR